MDKEKLIKTLQITKEIEYESLYPWSIQEVDAEGNVEKDKYIPFRWTLFFDATNIAYFFNTTRRKGEEEDSRRIRADLSLDTNGYIFPPKISFFGTDSNIDNIEMSISPVSEFKDAEEALYFHGIPMYKYENEIQSDAISIDMYLNDEKFNELKDLVIAKTISGLSIRVTGVEGLYAPWSPSIKPDEIKVLSMDNGVIEIKDDELKDLKIPRSELVSEWGLHYKTDMEFVSQKIEDEDIEGLYEEEEEEEEEEEILTQRDYYQEVANAELYKISNILSQTPIYAYIIIGLLVVIALILI